MAVTGLRRCCLTHYIFVSILTGTVLILMYNTVSSSHLTGRGDSKSVASSQVSSPQSGKETINIRHRDISEWRKYVSQLDENELVGIAERHIGPNNLTTTLGLKQFENCGGFVFEQTTNNIQYLHTVGMKASPQYCSKTMSFRKEGPVVALASFPGSGNSWVRQLIEEVTGIYTGGVYCDFSYVVAGMIGEGITTGNVIVMKTHTPPWHNKYAKAIYILRNPFGTILSEWSRRITPHTKHISNHVTELGEEKFGNNTEWQKGVAKLSDEWQRHIKQWLGANKHPLMVIQYENLFINLGKELKRILDFLEFPYTDDTIQCVLSSQSTRSSFHRSHKRSFDPYTASQKENILHLIENLNYRQPGVLYGVTASPETCLISEQSPKTNT